MSPCYLRSMLQGHLCNRWSWLWSPTMLAFQPHCTAPWLHSSGSCRARGWAQLQLCFSPSLLQSFTDFFEGTEGWTCIHTRVGKIMSTFWAPHARTLQLRLQISSGDRTKEFHVIPDLLTQNPTSYCSMTISFQNHPATQKKSVRLNANRRPIQLVAPKRGNPAPALTHLIPENMSTYNCKRESKPP